MSYVLEVLGITTITAFDPKSLKVMFGNSDIEKLTSGCPLAAMKEALKKRNQCKYHAGERTESNSGVGDRRN